MIYRQRLNKRWANSPTSVANARSGNARSTIRLPYNLPFLNRSSAAALAAARSRFGASLSTA